MWLSYSWPCTGMTSYSAIQPKHRLSPTASRSAAHLVLLKRISLTIPKFGSAQHVLVSVPSKSQDHLSHALHNSLTATAYPVPITNGTASRRLDPQPPYACGQAETHRLTCSLTPQLDMPEIVQKTLVECKSKSCRPIGLCRGRCEQTEPFQPLAWS
jgi:hypothetical protein